MTAWSSVTKRKILREGGSGLHGRVSNSTLGACPRAHIAFSGGKTRSLPGKPELKDETLRLRGQLIENRRHKTSKNLAVAENKYAEHPGVGGKNRTAGLPFQFGGENHVSAIPHIGKTPVQSKEAHPEDDEQGQSPDENRRPAGPGYRIRPFGIRARGSRLGGCLL